MDVVIRGYIEFLLDNYFPKLSKDIMLFDMLKNSTTCVEASTQLDFIESLLEGNYVINPVGEVKLSRKTLNRQSTDGFKLSLEMQRWGVISSEFFSTNQPTIELERENLARFEAILNESLENRFTRGYAPFLPQPSPHLRIEAPILREREINLIKDIQTMYLDKSQKPLTLRV